MHILFCLWLYCISLYICSTETFRSDIMKQLRALSLIIVILYAISTMAQLPERTPWNVGKYKKICREHIYKEMKGMYRDADGTLKYPFLAHGNNQYLDLL
jgi:hypothetical protein